MVTRIKRWFQGWSARGGGSNLSEEVVAEALGFAMAASVSPPIERQLRPWMGPEISSEEAVYGRWSWADDEIPHPSKVLELFSAPDHGVGDLYREMFDKDVILYAYAVRRANKVLTAPAWVIPADHTPKALQTGQACRQLLDEIPAVSCSFRHALMNFSTGVQFFERHPWERIERGPLAGAIVFTDLLDRPMARFGFRRDDPAVHVRRGDVRELIKPENPLRVFGFRRGTKDSPWGWGVLNPLFWPWMLRKNGLKDFAKALATFGEPTAYTKYPRKEGLSDAVKKQNEQNRKDALRALGAFLQKRFFAIPENFSVDTLESKRGGNPSYENLVRLCDHSYGMIYGGEGTTGATEKGPGSFAKAKISNLIRLEPVKRDAEFLQRDFVRRHIFRPFVRLNYGQDAPVPHYFIDAASADERQERRENLITWLLLRRGCEEEKGYEVPLRYVRNTLQIPELLPGDQPFRGALAVSAKVAEASVLRMAPQPLHDDNDDDDNNDDDEREEAA